MLSGKVPKFFSRKNSNRKRPSVSDSVASSSITSGSVRDDGGGMPVYRQPLSPVSERSFSLASEAPRPVPPPQHFHDHDEQFGYDPDELDEPHSRLYETFPASDDGRHATPLPVPLVVRHDDDDELEHTPIHHYPEPILHHGDHNPEDYNYELASAHSEHARREPVRIAASDHSHSSGRGQRVTFIGDLRHPEHGSPSLRRRRSPSLQDLGSDGHSHDRVGGSLLRTPSTSAREFGSGDRLNRSATFHGRPSGSLLDFGSSGRLRPPYSSSSVSGRRGRAHAHQESASRSPRYELQLPYMIFADFGEGLEIGNEVDGFMPYEEYLSTSHLRVPKESMYFIIPGNTPVIFHDEDGRELYRIDAQKYNTPTLRRRKYIIQDEFGNELYRIGNFGDRTRNDFLSSPSGGSSGSGSHSSRSKPPRVIYLNPDNGSVSSRPKYNRSARSRYTDLSSRTSSDGGRTVSSSSSAPDILVVDEDGQRIYDSRDLGKKYHPSLPRSRFASKLRNHDHADRPNYAFVDEFGRPVDKETDYPRIVRSASSSGSTDDSYEHLPRRSQIIYA